MSTYRSVRDLLSALGLAPDAPWSIYASAGSDTRPVVYLGEQALRHKAAEGCTALGLALPASPRLQVMLDHEADPFDDFSHSDDRTSVTRVGRPEAITLGSSTGSLSTMRFESAYEGWDPEDVALVRLKTTNEQFAMQVAHEGRGPTMFVGVTDGCATVGGPSARCSNELLDPNGLQRQRADLVPDWWVTDHFRAATPTSALACGTIVHSTDAGFPFQFRAVARLSEHWGRYGGWGFGGVWLFHVEASNTN